MRIAYDRGPTARHALLAALVPLTLVVGALVVGASAPARACSCVQIDLPSLARQHDAVFVGTPVAVDEQGGQRTYEVRVSDVYKGSPGPTTTVTTAAAEPSCGIELELHRQYLVIGRQPETHGPVATTLCSGTDQISDRGIAEVEQALGPATPYRGPPGDTGDGPRGDQNDDPGQNEGGHQGDEPGRDQGRDRGDGEPQSSESSDGDRSTSYVVVGGVLALAIGGSFLLPRLRRRGRSDG